MVIDLNVGKIDHKDLLKWQFITVIKLFPLVQWKMEQEHKMELESKMEREIGTGTENGTETERERSGTERGMLR